MENKDQKVVDKSKVRQMQEILRKKREEMTPEEKKAREARIQELLKKYPQL